MVLFSRCDLNGGDLRRSSSVLGDKMEMAMVGWMVACRIPAGDLMKKRRTDEAEFASLMRDGTKNPRWGLLYLIGGEPRQRFDFVLGFSVDKFGGRLICN